MTSRGGFFQIIEVLQRREALNENTKDYERKVKESFDRRTKK
jgi:hypothetical protein